MARRKEMLLGLLMVGLAVVLWKNLAGGGGVLGSAGFRGGTIGRADLAALQVFPVDWVSLSAPRPSYDPAGRNIFQFGKPPPPPKPQISKAEQDAIDAARAAAERARREALEAARLRNQARAEQAARKPPPPQERKEQPPPPPPKAQPPRIKYKFIGYLGPPANKIAVLHDGKDMIFVSQGDQLEDKFEILEIGYESIKFGFVDPKFESESRTLPMTSTP